MLQFIIRNSLVAIQLPLTREARILCGARDYCSFAMVVRMTVFGATGGASKASDRCSFAKISGNNKDWCNGRSELLPYEKRAG